MATLGRGVRKTELVPHSKVGGEGGVEYKITDPVQKLMHTIGGGLFNEPTYYTDPNKVNADGVSENVQDLLDTFKECAERFPEELMAILMWAREELHLRQTPTMGFVVASRVFPANQLLVPYVDKILQRPDEIINAFAAYRHLYSDVYTEKATGRQRFKGSLPNQLKKALRKRMSSLSEKDILKYAGGKPPTFWDVARMIKGRKKDGPFMSHEIYQYLRTGEILDGRKTKVLHNRRKFNECKDFDKSLPFAKKSFVTWEVFNSKWGSSKDEAVNKKCWEWLIENLLLGYMATLRNLRNFEQAGIDEKYWDQVCDYIEKCKTHKQLPFRFLSAMKNTNSARAQKSIEIALENSVDNVPKLPGNTCVMVDLSGSMDAAISAKSTMSRAEVGCVMAAIFTQMQGPKTHVYGFGKTFQRAEFGDKDKTIMAMAKKIRDLNVGHSTEAWKVMKHVNDKDIPFERIVILSDMCCYGGGRSNLATLFAQYHSRHPETWMYSINLSGDSLGSQMDPRNPRVCLLSGFSENIFRLFGEIEGITDVEGKGIPAIEDLKKRYLVEKT